MASARLRLSDKLIIFDRAIVRKLGITPGATVVGQRCIYVSYDNAVMFQGAVAADGRFFVVGSDGKLWAYEPWSRESTSG